MFVHNLKSICLLNICDNWKTIMGGFNVGLREEFVHRAACCQSGNFPP